MTEQWPASHELRDAGAGTARRSTWPFVLLIAGLVFVTGTAAVVSNGNLVVTIAPLAALLVGYALVKSPIRYVAVTMMFASLVLENPPENFAEDHWKSPLAPLGALLLTQLKYTIPAGPLVMTGADVLLVFLFTLYLVRRTVGSRVDVHDLLPIPRPLLYASWVYLGGVILALFWGLITGGSGRWANWQIQRVAYLPILFLFMQIAIPGPKFFPLLGKVVLTAACIRAVLAIYIRRLFPELGYTTTHADSMLFATATCMLVIQLIEKRDRASFRTFLFLFPLLFWGMFSNNRRLVWVEIVETLLLMLFVTRASRFKVKLARFVLVAAPVLALYCAAGWNSGGGIFRPVAMIRSVVDSKSDSSSHWRDIENFDLMATLKQHPVLGTGYGHPFDMPVPLGIVYELEPYVPHNSMLGMWAYTGYVGFSMLWMILAVGIFYAMRAYKTATLAQDRVIALSCFSAIVIYMLHCYGDMALGTWVSLYLVPTALVVAGKLSVSLGAWPMPRRAAGNANP